MANFSMQLPPKARIEVRETSFRVLGTVVVSVGTEDCREECAIYFSSWEQVDELYQLLGALLTDHAVTTGEGVTTHA